MSDDKHLKRAVVDELRWEHSVNAADIGTTVKDGIVTLMGHVEKHGAETAAVQVKDVKTVAEEIEGKLPFNVKHGDQEIAQAAIHRLAWNVSIPKDAVKVTVVKRRVTLAGEVEWHCQHMAAFDAVRSLWGVSGMRHGIVIKPKATADGIKVRIVTAPHRSWLEPAHIHLAAANGNHPVGNRG
jgi:osmotically-inducible protein OsmY